MTKSKLRFPQIHVDYGKISTFSLNENYYTRSIPPFEV